MFGRWHLRLRHPFYPGVPATRTARASGTHTALAGRFEELAEAAAKGVQAARAVYVLQEEDEPSITPSERDLLWAWFPVPSFVLVVDERGRLLAYECEAQDGLHLPGEDPGDAQGRLCACGRPGPKVSVYKRAPAPQLLVQAGGTGAA